MQAVFALVFFFDCAAVVQMISSLFCHQGKREHPTHNGKQHEHDLYNTLMKENK